MSRNLLNRVAPITTEQFIQMWQSKEYFCELMNDLAHDLGVTYKFEIKDGVLTMRDRRIER